MTRRVDDRAKLPKQMNAKLDQVLEPSEPVLVTLQGLSGSGIAATDRRALLWKRKTLRAFRYDELTGIEWGRGVIRWVLLRGPGLDPTRPGIANVSVHPNAIHTSGVTTQERAEFERLVAAGARVRGGRAASLLDSATGGGLSGEVAPAQVVPSGETAVRPMSLWEQPSFLVAFGLCLVCLSTFVSGTQAAQEARPGAIVFLILTALVYALYRSKLGWGAVPTRGWLPSRHFTRRRWFGLGIYFLLVVSVAGGLSTPRKAGSPGAAEAPWTKGMTATTCGDWLSVMTDRQRQAFAEALLAYDLSRPHGPALDQTTATEYASVITDTCRNDSPSSLVVQ